MTQDHGWSLTITMRGTFTPDSLPVFTGAFVAARYFFICKPDNLSLFNVCADNSGHLHHVDRLAFFQVGKVSDLA